MGRIVQFKNPFFKFIGNISLEVYLIHGLYENIFKKISLISNNNLIYGFVVLVLSIVSAFLIKKIYLLNLSRKEVMSKWK